MAADLDEKVTAVIGTHTHIQTNDARVTPGAAAVTDAGMTGRTTRSSASSRSWS